MDIKFQNKQATKHNFASILYKVSLLTLSLIIIASAATISCEKTIAFHSYFYDSDNIQQEAIRCAKNLQRYYIYFKNFDPTVAEREIKGLDEYLLNKKSEKPSTKQKQTYYDVDNFYTDKDAPVEESAVVENEAAVNFDITLNEATSDSDNPTLNYSTELVAEDVDIAVDDNNINEEIESITLDKPEELYSFNISDLENLSANEVYNMEVKLSEALQNYYSVRNYIDTMEHFHYYIYDTNYGRLIATNADNFNKETVYDSISITDNLFADINFQNSNLADSFINNGLECTLSIPINSSSYFIQNEVHSLQRLIKINRILSSPVVFLAVLVVGLVMFAYTMYFYKATIQKINVYVYSKFSKLPLIFKLLFIPAVIIAYVSHYDKNYFISRLIAYDNWDRAFMIVLGIFVILLLFILCVESIYNLIREPKKLRNEVDVNFMLVSLRNFRFAIRTQSYFLIFIYISVFALFILSSLFMLVLLPRAFQNIQYMLIYLLMCFPVFIMAMVIKLINAHIKLSWYIKEMSLGNIEVIPTQSGLFAAPLNNLNNINDGVKRTMNEALKNERLKTELITNVSHDLKTPLTSIISYVNLLKELAIADKSASNYIDIIENKAIRLKILIDDLFEASKLSSGQMKLEKADSDIVSLLRQTMGELSYKIDESGIDFKTNLPETPVMLNIDGQKMWRVFDNMLNNILKYSPAGSRAYIDIKDKEDRTVITFKNVSSYPLDFDTGELFERFKRGDAARATEGSGLGLSIAKSIVELHNGSMSIVTDGDLFKVIIILYKN